MVVVQFSVDLAQESLAPSDVIYLQSTFNGWCGNCAPMARLSPSSDVWVRNETRPDGEEILIRIIFVFVAIGAIVICCVCCAVYVTLQHGASRPRAKTLPAWLSRGPSSWLQASRTPRVDFGEEGINMLTVRVSHQMASQI